MFSFKTPLPVCLGCDTLLPMLLPRPLQIALDKVARAAVGKDWPLYASLLDHWREIVGPEYAQIASPVKVAFPKGKKPDEKWANRREGGTLHIKLPQGLAMEFGFLSETIRARINGFFGYGAIARIVLEPFYSSEPPEKEAPPQPLSEDDKKALSQNVKDIENDELKDVLHQLGESVLTKKNS